MKNVGIALICLGLVGALAQVDSSNNPVIGEAITPQQVQENLQKLEQLSDEQLDQLVEYFSISQASSPGFGYIGDVGTKPNLLNEQLDTTVPSSSLDTGVSLTEATMIESSDSVAEASDPEDSIENLGFPFLWKKKKNDEDDCDDDDDDESGDAADNAINAGESSRNKVIVVTFGHDDNATLARMQEFQSQTAENNLDQESVPNKKVFHFKEGTIIPLTTEDELQLEEILNLHQRNNSAGPSESFDQYTNGAKPRLSSIRNGFGIRKLNSQYANSATKRRVSVSAVGATVLVMYSVLFM